MRDEDAEVSTTAELRHGNVTEVRGGSVSFSCGMLGCCSVRAKPTYRKRLMKPLMLAIAVCALVANNANAAVWEVPVAGTYDGQFDPTVYPGLCDTHADTCEYQGALSGYLTVVAPSAASGVYTVGTSVDYDFYDGTLPLELSGFSGTSDNGYLQITVLGGAVTSLAGSFWNGYWQVFLSGDSFEAIGQESHGSVRTSGSFALPAVPEPAPLAMVAAGLTLLGVRRARQKMDAGCAST